MRRVIWATQSVWRATLAVLILLYAQQALAKLAPAAPPPPSTFADVPVKSKAKPAAKVIRAGPSRMTLADRAAAERAGPPGTGKSNLACVVFEGRTGPDARSTLYNRCGTGVRLFRCLQYKNGADNCVGLALDDSMATLWDLTAGQSLVMPATDILKRWVVFACEAPLTPWGVLFRDGNLVGDCVETGLEPPPGAPAPKPTIRSNDPSTWPVGTVNMTCLSVAPVLTRYFQMQLINHCGRPLNVVTCATTNVAVGAWQCATPVPDHIGPPTDPDWPVMLPRPSQIIRWSAFACVDPAVPRNLRYDGSRIVGDCIGPAEVDTAATLPRRSGNKATARLSDETSEEEIATRAQQRSATSEAINNERSRISSDANNLLGVLADVAVATAETYTAVKAQQQEQQLLPQQQTANAAQQQIAPIAEYNPSPSSNPQSPSGSSGRHEVLVSHSGACAQVVNQRWDSDVEGMLWFEFHNSCSFPINIWHNQLTDGRFSEMSTAPAGGNSSRSWENPSRYGRTGINFISCPQFENGQDVHKHEEANGGFYCFYYGS